MAELTVADWPAMVAWHAAALGLAVELRDEKRGFALLSHGNGAKLALKVGTPPPAGVTLHWQVADLDAEVLRLRALGAEVGPVTASDEGYWRAVVTSPEGHRHGLFAWTGRVLTAVV